MAWSEHLGGNKYKIVERDPSKAKNPKRSITVYMPEDIAKSRSDKKKYAWLATEEEKWSEQVISGNLEGKRSKSKKMTFAEFIPTWLKIYAEPNMSGETVLNSVNIINSRLIPSFGDTWIDQITTLQLAEWFSELKNLRTGTELATNSKLNIYKAAKSIFAKAYEWKIISRDPMEGVERPTANKKEKKKMKDVKQSYSTSEVAELLLALYKLPDRWRLYFTGVMLGGFRRGEFLAVELTDLDYDSSMIFIEKQITVDKDGNKVESEVKTIESEGWVPMPKWYMDELKLYERQWKKEKMKCTEWLGEGKQYVFHSGNGVMYYPSTPTRTWAEFLRKNDFPHVKLHGLRHTAATLLRDHGADQRSIQKFLRHAKLETTNRYTHESETVNRAAIAPLESLNPKRMQFAP
ncbi:tyrosine-type recombinase/integrase [Paenibacillus illinoisensis]|uniref:tyrosine-type recombinase/integrase n=1 Tax=Paenibacillus illinoisensis TaxID=59845 RepID=UPI000FDB1FE4|nr:site-specific integrase [Paenibacillus illinoisensis]